MPATFKPGIYVGQDHGGASGPGEPYWGFTDNAEVMLTGTTSFAPGWFQMLYAGPQAYSSGYEYWGAGGTVLNMLPRAYAWVTAHANRKLVFRTAPGFTGGSGSNPRGQVAYDAVVAGNFTSMTQDMVTALYNAGPAPGLLPYVIIDPWWELGAPWFPWAASNVTGPTTYSPRGNWITSTYNAYRKYIGDAKAKELALTGTNFLKFGFSWDGETDTVAKIGVSMTTGGPAGTGCYPGDAYIDYLTGDIYSNNWSTTLFAEIRNFAQAHGKKIITPEFGWADSITTEATDIAFLQAYQAEVAGHAVWEGFVDFNFGTDFAIYEPFSGSTNTPLNQHKPNVFALFRSMFGTPLNQPGASTTALSNVTTTQIGTNTVRVAGLATSDILGVVIFDGATHTAIHQLGIVAPASGAFSVDIQNVAVGGPYAWDACGVSAVPPAITPIIATTTLSVTVTAAATLTLVGPSTSGTTRTIPFTTTGGVSNVTAYEPPFVKTLGTNDVHPVAGAGTIVATGLSNGAHTITVYAFSGVQGDPAAVILDVKTDTFTIAAQPTADEFDGTALNGVLWTVSKPTGDPSTATVSGGELVLSIPQVDVTDNTTRANNASISVGSAFTGGYTLLGAGSAALASNAIHDTNTAGVDTIERAEQDLGTPDMSVEVQLALWTPSGATTVAYGVLARVGTGATPDYYIALIAPAAGPIWDVYLFKKVGGVSTLLGDTTATGHITAPVVGGASSKLRLEAVGNKITTYLNDAVVIPTVTDGAITTGNFGAVFMNRATGGVDVSVKNPRVASYFHQNYTIDRSVGVEQTVADGDFPEQEIRFRVPSLSLTGTGIQYRNSATGDRALFYVYTDNVGPHVLATTVTGGVATNVSGVAPSFPLADGLLQVSRVGNVWNFWTAASDGTNRIAHGQFTFAMSVDRIKVFAINQPAA